jgi:AGZA family xanthine/uracil permease-like MFS transporter
VAAREGGGERVSATTSTGGGGIAGFFKFAERGTDLSTEVRAGLTTFMVMAYIIAVNPLILSVQTEGLGPPQIPTIVATALTAGILCLAMGLLTNYPFAMAAGLGLNAVVAFDLILGRGLPWQQAMAVIAWEGILITILVITGLRRLVMDAIPLSLKRAIAVGIGLFILLIGLVNGGFVTGSGATPLDLAALTNVAFLTFVIGLALALALMVRGVKGALLISIIATTVVAIVLKSIVGAEASGFLPGAAELPTRILTDFGSDDPFSTILAPLGAMVDVWTNPELSAVTVALVVFSLMLSDFFDTMGTVIGVGTEAKLVDRDGQLPGVDRVLLVDSAGAVLGGLFSASSNTTYIESAAGVSEGGRTGLTAVVVGALFLLAILFAPVIAIVPQQATAPALVIVGFLMFTIARDIDWGDIDDLFPALLTMVVMPFTYSITDGIAAGFISYVFLKAVRGRGGEVHPLMWAVSLAFIVYFAIPWLQSTYGI